MSIVVRYHQQESSSYCGPACAQMTLQSIGAGLLEQDELWNRIHDYPSSDPSSIGWSSAPDCLQWGMNDSRPAGYPITIDLHAVESKGALSRKIVWSIHHHHLPAIVLTSGMSHWIVVRGFTTDAAPTSASDTSYDIFSLDINNPTVVPYAPPPPHGDADLCGSGGDRGLAENNVSYTHWLAAYLHPVTSGYWSGKFLAICDPDPPPLRSGMVAATKTPEKGEQILSPARAQALVVAAMSQFGLDKRASWEPFLRDAKPGRPILVQRLDRHDSFYYIVPLQTEKAVPVLVSIDARFGSYLEAGRTANPQDNALAGLNLDATWAEQQIVGSKIDLGKRGRLTIRKEALALYPTLVWRPCRESRSPFLPFFMATVGNRRLYLRVDGRLFTRLHTRDRA